MPNWKKLITSGSSGSLANLTVDNHLSASIISGSFYGDGTNLTGVTSYTDSDTLSYINSVGVLSGSAQITSLTSYTETFTGSSAVTASHNLGTKNVNVQCYGSDDFQFFPSSIKTHDTNNVYVTFNSSRTGRIVITK